MDNYDAVGQWDDNGDTGGVSSNNQNDDTPQKAGQFNRSSHWRKSLEFHPRVRDFLTRLWNDVDVEGKRVLQKDHYVHLRVRIARSLRHDTQQAERMASKDWTVDSLGYDFLDYERFTLVMFKVAERWHCARTAEDYARFLESVFQEKKRTADGSGGGSGGGKENQSDGLQMAIEDDFVENFHIDDRVPTMAVAQSALSLDTSAVNSSAIVSARSPPASFRSDAAPTFMSSQKNRPQTAGPEFTFCSFNGMTLDDSRMIQPEAKSKAVNLSRAAEGQIAQQDSVHQRLRLRRGWSNASALTANGTFGGVTRAASEPRMTGSHQRGRTSNLQLGSSLTIRKSWTAKPSYSEPAQALYKPSDEQLRARASKHEQSVSSEVPPAAASSGGGLARNGSNITLSFNGDEAGFDSGASLTLQEKLENASSVEEIAELCRMPSAPSIPSGRPVEKVSPDEERPLTQRFQRNCGLRNGIVQPRLSQHVAQPVPPSPCSYNSISMFGAQPEAGRTSSPSHDFSGAPLWAQQLQHTMPESEETFIANYQVAVKQGPLGIQKVGTVQQPPKKMVRRRRRNPRDDDEPARELGERVPVPVMEAPAPIVRQRKPATRPVGRQVRTGQLDAELPYEDFNFTVQAQADPTTYRTAVHLAGVAPNLISSETLDELRSSLHQVVGPGSYSNTVSLGRQATSRMTSSSSFAF
jgi:hypothetical protein